VEISQEGPCKKPVDFILSQHTMTAAVLTILILASTSQQCCYGERAGLRRLNVTRAAAAVIGRRSLQSDNATDFAPSPTESPADWVIAVTTDRTAAAVTGDSGEGFGGRLTKRNVTEPATVFDPFVDAEAGKQVIYTL
jgi:hypothetical protein